MRYSSQSKPISYLKANTVPQDVASFEGPQEPLSLLRVRALGNQDVEAARTKPLAEVVSRLRAKRKTA